MGNIHKPYLPQVPWSLIWGYPFATVVRRVEIAGPVAEGMGWASPVALWQSQKIMEMVCTSSKPFV
jgi:hypothetical protein